MNTSSHQPISAACANNEHARCLDPNLDLVCKCPCHKTSLTTRTFSASGAGPRDTEDVQVGEDAETGKLATSWTWTDAQADGRACVVCGSEDGAMAPADERGPGGVQLFRHAEGSECAGTWAAQDQADDDALNDAQRIRVKLAPQGVAESAIVDMILSRVRPPQHRHLLAMLERNRTGRSDAYDSGVDAGFRNAASDFVEGALDNVRPAVEELANLVGWLTDLKNGDTEPAARVRVMATVRQAANQPGDVDVEALRDALAAYDGTVDRIISDKGVHSVGAPPGGRKGRHAASEAPDDDYEVLTRIERRMSEALDDYRSVKRRMAERSVQDMTPEERRALMRQLRSAELPSGDDTADGEDQ